MSKKRHVTTKTRNRRRKSYVQKHPQAQKGLPPVKVEGDDVPKLLMIIILIIAIVAVLVYLIQGGVAGYDRYPGDWLIR
jgi:hypothetical protein